MALIGKRNTLTVIRSAPPGFYLDGGTHGEILLPGRYATKGFTPGTTVDVFVYRDSEDRVVATTETPKAMVGEFACLQVVGLNQRIGVFLDWGLDKDLLLPIREMNGPVNAGDNVVVFVTLDWSTDRVMATARINRHLSSDTPTYAEGRQVKLLVEAETPLGYNVIVENAHRGLLYRTDLSGPLKTGATMTGYVRTVRADGKIDVSLNRAGFHRIAPLTEQILAALKEKGGRLPLHDNSPPEEIRAALGMSKKAFKQAIGSLFRDRKIFIDPDGIRLVPSGPR